MAISSFVTVKIVILLITIRSIRTEDGYLRYVKDGCFVNGEALSCLKYKGLKTLQKTFFGDNINSNDTIILGNSFSFIPLDKKEIKEVPIDNDEIINFNSGRGLMSEWAELTKYIYKIVKDFFRMKGLRINLPDGARTIENEEANEGRGRKKKLALVVPLLTLLAVLKSKLLLIPILLGVLLLKKLLLAAAVLLPGLLSTLKSCKHHHPAHHYSYFGSNDSSDFNSDYGNTYAYSSGAGYGKDWASSRAYSMPRIRPTPAPTYITAPGMANA